MDTDTKQSARHFLDLIKQSHRGKFKIYIGMSAGVGKTYRMLQEAHQLLEAGVDVRIGYIETHGRPETEALVAGLPVIPRRRLFYKGKELEELDMQGVINLHPEIVVVDELAHTNIEGSINSKRWQDVMQILDAGVSVISAINIQHIEGVNEQVQEITGIEVHERVPDSVLAMADEVVNIDLTADELIARLKAGKIYKPEKVPTALNNFFRQENILQLRELALKEVALRVEKKVENEVIEQPAQLPFAGRDRQQREARPAPDPQDGAHGHAPQCGLSRALRAERQGEHRPDSAGQPALSDQQLRSDRGVGRRGDARAFESFCRGGRGRGYFPQDQPGLHQQTPFQTPLAARDGRADAPVAQPAGGHEHRLNHFVVI